MSAGTVLPESPAPQSEPASPPSGRRPSVLLLDAGGVLHFPRAELGESLEQEHVWRDGFRAFREELVADPEYAEALLGRAEVVRVLDRLLPAHVDGLTGRAFLDAWMSMGTEPNRRLEAVLPELDVEEIHLAANQERRRSSWFERMYRGRPWFTGVLFSCDLGVAKPDPGYFGAAARALGRAPEECLLVDDREANAAAARRSGMSAVRYESVEQLTAELTGRGLLAAV